MLDSMFLKEFSLAYVKSATHGLCDLLLKITQLDAQC